MPINVYEDENPVGSDTTLWLPPRVTDLAPGKALLTGRTDRICQLVFCGLA
jgi:hypothetical protein